ncbi:Mediator of RNA polymerase II transcription subunit 11 [Linum perenne]
MESQSQNTSLHRLQNVEKTIVKVLELAGGVMDELANPMGPRKELINNHCREFMQMIKDIQFTLRNEIKSTCEYRPFEKCDYSSRISNEICFDKLEYVLSSLDGMTEAINQYHSAAAAGTGTELQFILEPGRRKKMASAASFPARSNSLPARTHPLASEFDDQVCRLRQSQSASTSSASIGHKLSSLQDIYDCVDKFLQLPTTRQSLIHDKKSFDEALDGSLRLLDLCNTAKDVLSQTKESVSDLQSAIRRRQEGGEATKRFINSRKVVKKVVQGALSNKKSSSCSCSSSMLGEVESIVVEVLESLLCFISKSNSKHWMTRRLQKTVDNEFAEVDTSLKTMNESREEVRVLLKNLQPCIQDLEEGVECLFRRLIKTRASILNILD